MRGSVNNIMYNRVRSFSRGRTRAFSSSTDPERPIVIVGGGIAGVSSAWKFALRGRKVICLEQNSLTSGTTWHAAGLVTGFKGNPAVAHMAVYGREVFEKMTAEGEQIGWYNTGSMGVARRFQSFLPLLEKAITCTSLTGHEHQVIETFEEAKKIHPFIANTNGDFHGAVYSPAEGIVNPADCTQMIAKRARAAGAIIKENCEVIGLELSADGRVVEAVKTSDGETIYCDQILVTGGAWTRHFVKEHMKAPWLGLGMGPHQYTIFEKIPGVSNSLPVMREYDACFYLKPEVGGFMLGIFEAQPVPHIPEHVMQRNYEGVPNTAMNEVYEESLDKADPWFEKACEYYPVLAETGIHQWLYGPDTHSCDHGFMMGPIPGIENGFVAGGFNSQGIQCGPAIGLAMSEWMLDGYPHTIGDDFVHFQDHNPYRFNADVVKNDDWTTYRALESYGDVYASPPPRQQPESVRGLALHHHLFDELKAQGAVFGEAVGWERPLYFDPENKDTEVELTEWETITPHPGNSKLAPHSDLGLFFNTSRWQQFERAECLHTRTAVTATEMSQFGKIMVTGEDALEFVNYMVTGDIAKKNPNSITYTCVCNENGGILSDLTVCKISDTEIYLVMPASDPRVVYDHMMTYKKRMGFKSDIEEKTADISAIAIMGPDSRKLMEAMYPNTNFDNESFPFSTSQVIDENVRALRVSFVGEMGWELHGHGKETTKKFYKKAFEIAEKENIDLKPCGIWAVLMSMRMEKGFVHNNHDLAPNITPFEAGIGFSVDAKKDSDYCGKEILIQKKKSPKKRLISFIFEDKDINPRGHYSDIVWRNGEKVGYLCSYGYSYTLDRPLGLGFVDITGKKKGVKLRPFLEDADYEVELVGPNGITRTKVKPSFSCVYDPKGAKLHGEVVKDTPASTEEQSGAAGTQKSISMQMKSK